MLGYHKNAPRVKGYCPKTASRSLGLCLSDRADQLDSEAHLCKITGAPDY